MTGYEYEYFVAEYLEHNGFHDVTVTKGSGDMGVDIIAYDLHENKYAIQCKYYSSAVPFKAIQEIHTGKSLYNCQYAMVVTNDIFSEQARTTAQKLGIILLEHISPKTEKERVKWIDKYLEDNTQDFSDNCYQDDEQTNKDTILEQVQDSDFDYRGKNANIQNIEYKKSRINRYSILAYLAIGVLVALWVWFIMSFFPETPKDEAEDVCCDIKIVALYETKERDQVKETSGIHPEKIVRIEYQIKNEKQEIVNFSPDQIFDVKDDKNNVVKIYSAPDKRNDISIGQTTEQFVCYGVDKDVEQLIITVIDIHTGKKEEQVFSINKTEG